MGLRLYGRRLLQPLTNTPHTTTTMSIYIAQKLDSGNKSHSAFQFRGIGGYTQATPSETHIVGNADIREAAYSGYKDNIDIFVLANNLEKRIRLDNEGRKYTPRGIVPLPIGPLVFKVNASLKLTSDQEDRLLASLGQARKEKSGKSTTKFTVLEVTSATFAKIQSFADEDFGVGADEISMKGGFLAITLLQLIHEFLATNMYSAFREGIDETDWARYGEIAMAHERTMPGGAYDSTGLEVDVFTRVGAFKKARLTAIPEEGRTEEQVAELRELHPTTKNNRGVGSTLLRDMIWTATPKRGDPTTNYGPAASCPESSGLVFPYFKGMNAPDALTLKTSITTFFLRCLGEGLADSKKVMQKLRAGTGNLAGTDIGMAIVHILTGIRLTLETQTRLYLVIEDREYRGFILLGYHFSIFDTTRWVPAVSSAQVRSAMQQLNTHSTNLSAVCELLSGLSVTGAEDIEEVDASMILSSADLIREIRRRKIELTEEEEEHANLNLRAIYFGAPYKTATVETITWLLNSLTTDDMPDPQIPQYLYQIKGDYSDRVYRYLLCFGPDAPVPMTQSGGQYSIPQPGKADEIFAPAEGKPLEAIVFYLKAPHVARQDWAGVIKSRTVRMNLKERSGPYKAIFFKTLPSKKVLWDILREVAWKKREVEEKEVPVAKRAKIGSAGELFALFD